MTAYRSFEANQKVLQAYDKSMDKAVNEIGRLR
jgi:flagellar basal-body rod protein FlgG